MTSTIRAIAESRFAALTRRENVAITEVEAERRATLEKTSRLRAQRLAKEAQATADRVAKLKQHRRNTATA